MPLPETERRVAAFYDEVRFGLPTETPAHLELGRQLLARLGLRPEQLAGKRVLEAATGRGNWSAILAQAAGSYVGIDLSPASIAWVAREITPRVARANLKRLPFPSRAFDVVFAIGVLPAVDDDRAALAELARILAPGGQLMMMGYGRVQPRNLLRDLLFAFAGNAGEERQNKLSFQLTRLSRWPLPPSLLFMSDQLFAQRDWWFAPIQNRHTQPQLARWLAEEGLRLETFIPYPHEPPMRLHQWLVRVPGINRLLGPDWYLTARHPVEDAR